MMNSLCEDIFLTEIYKIDAMCAEKMEVAISSFKGFESNPWKLVGFKYFGAFSSLDKAFEDKESKLLHRAVGAVMNKKNDVVDIVNEGIISFNDFALKFGIDRLVVCESVRNYFNEGLTFYDEELFMHLFEDNVKGNFVPFSVHDKWSIGVVNPWPGSMSAEAEVLSRLSAAADDAGIELKMLSNFGHILNSDTQKQTDVIVSPKDLDFVISTHYDTHKCIDRFYYHTLWNPPEIPLNLNEYAGRISDNYLMNDDYLIYDDGGMSKHLECILQNCPRSICDASSLTASFPASKMMTPKLDNPKMFYCGMNWERVVSNSNRHEGLFKLLDNTGCVKFFGPEKVEAWGGIRPWEGYKCYQHSIPFDGFSILDEINDCGICLVLSSDIHRRAGAATNRTYEACAAGAVIISDDNPFMLKYFKDAALFIDYNKNDPEDTFNQLMEKYEWILSHKNEALELAHNAQRIFKNNFALDSQLLSIVQNHPSRLAQIKQDLYAEDDSKVVLATFVINSQEEKTAKELLEPFFLNIRNQYYSNILPVVIVDDIIAPEISDFCKRQLYSCEILSVKLFDFKRSRVMTDFEALSLAYEKYEHSFYINMRAEEVWFSDHVSTLVRCINEEQALAAYSGRLFEDSLGFRRTDMFRKITSSTLFHEACPDWLPVPGQILFSSESHKYVHPSMYPFIDGLEHWATLGILYFRENKPVAFSKRMTFNYIDGKFDERASVMPESMQIRLMQDSYKYFIPESGLFSTGVAMPEILRNFAAMPLKLFLKLRLKQIVLRILPSWIPGVNKIHSSFWNDMNKFTNFRI